MTLTPLRTPLLDDCWHKFRRGKEHYYSLETEIKQFRDSDPYTIVHEYDSERATNLFRLKHLRSVPQHTWGLILGDAVHNLRSALDFIAWRLAGSKLNDTTTQFPICDTPEKWTTSYWRLMKKGRPLHPDAIAEIAKFQPNTSPDRETMPLWLLQELDARDKHKLITMTQSYTRAAEFVGSGPITIPYSAFESRLEDGAILAESAGPPDVNVNVQVQLAFHVFFERASLSKTKDFEVLPSLQKIIEAVQVVIEVFEERIADNPNWIPSP